MNPLPAVLLCCCALAGPLVGDLAASPGPGGSDTSLSRPRGRISLFLPERIRRFIFGLSKERSAEGSASSRKESRLGANEETRTRAFHAFPRFLLWCAAVAALPWLTGFATHAAVEKKSNWASVVLLTGYTAVNTVLYFCIFAFQAPAGTWLWLFLCVLALTAVYDYRACERIASK